MKTYFTLIILSFHLISCSKDFLEEKPASNLVIPQTLADYQALIDNDRLIINLPFMLNWATDDIYISDNIWSSMQPVYRNAYIWKDDILEGQPDIQWDNLYEKLFYCNAVIDGINDLDLDANNPDATNAVLAAARYFRARVFYNITQLYTLPYDASTAETDPGIILRTNSNPNTIYGRASLKATYEQIIDDLNFAVKYLPAARDNIRRNRPSKPLVYGLLARVGLSMNDYDMAFENSNQSLLLHDTLIDYNIIDTVPARPFPRNNVELLNEEYSGSAFSWNQNYMIDSVLYNSYDQFDLRKALYFQTGATTGKPFYSGQLTGILTAAYSISTSEMLIVRAECNTRKGNVEEALNDLNRVLSHRYVAGKFIPYEGLSQDEALNLIIQERRKELFLRGLRWSDLRRLNKDPRFQQTLTKIINGQTYTLPPNDPKYVYLIPQNEINISGIQQNQR